MPARLGNPVFVLIHSPLVGPTTWLPVADELARRRREAVVPSLFYPEKLTIAIDGEKLEPAPGQNVVPHGPDRNLSVDEIGGIQLGGDAAAAEA